MLPGLFLNILGVRMSFVPFDPAKYDFSKAPLYRKTVKLREKDIERATIAQDVPVILDGKRESMQHAELGDYIITGVLGERFVVKQHEFTDFYEPDPKEAEIYRSKPVRRALRLVEDTAIPVSWGEQKMEKGSLVVQDVDGSIYGIQKEAFRKSYGRADEKGEVFIELDKPLIAQLRAASKLGLQAHLTDIKAMMREVGREGEQYPGLGGKS